MFRLRKITLERISHFCIRWERYCVSTKISEKNYEKKEKEWKVGSIYLKFTI